MILQPHFGGIYLAKTIVQKDTCTPVFTAALFTIVKTWKQPKCPLTDEWIKKMFYIYIMVLLFSHKKNEIMPFEAEWTNLEIMYQGSQRQVSYNITHVVLI